MEEQQPQPRSTKPPASVRQQSARRSQQPTRDQLARLLERYPLLLWGGIWVTVLLVTAIAISGLLSPSLPGGRQASSAAFGTGGTEIETARGGQVPVWVFGAIVLSCTAGSILVSKRLHRSGHGHRIAKPGHPRPYPAMINRPQRQPKVDARSPKRLQPFTDTEFAPFEEFQALPAEAVLPPAPVPAQPIARLKPLRPSRKKPMTKKTKKAAPVAVTVVPPEENHPLDWSDPGLADTMDIRKRRSLSSWM